MKSFLAGLGTAVPAMTVTREESLHIANYLCGPYLSDTEWLPGVYANCGVNTRHQALGRPLVDDLMAGTRNSGSPYLPGAPGGPTTAQRMLVYAREAPPLALEASLNAFKNSTVEPLDITHILTVSCTGFLAPGLDVYLMRELGLLPNVQRIHVGFMGCHGAINGIRTASAIVEADPTAKVLLVAVELCSLHYYYGAEPGKVIANALFADGAAAVIVVRSHLALRAEASKRILATGSHLIADSEREMGWVIGDHGFGMTLTKQIPKLISAHLRSWLEPWLRGHGVTLADVQQWCIHPGGPKILDAVQDSLGLSDEDMLASRDVLWNYGNMSSPTVLFILQQLQQQSQSELIGPTVLLGFGPGLVAEVALLG